MRVDSEIQSWGEGPTSTESPYRDSCSFEALAKQKKTPLTTVAISTDQCTARAGSEKTALNKQREELVSQNKTVV